VTTTTKTSGISISGEVKEKRPDISLKELVIEVTSIIEKRGLSQQSLNKYKHVFNEICDYLISKNEQIFSTEIGIQFLLDIYKIKNNNHIDEKSRLALRAVNMLSEYQHNSIISYRYIYSNNELNSENINIINSYNDYNKNITSAIRSLKNYINVAKNFLIFLQNNNLSLNSIVPSIILDFVKTFSGYNRYTIRNYTLYIKYFLKYLFNSNFLTTDFSYVIPKIRIPKLQTIPSIWKESDIDQLLKAIDRNNPLGKRDYAIILLAMRLGIRSIDIKNLTMENINWNKKTIEFNQSKNNKLLTLPLLDDVGWAVIDYLKNGRPCSMSNTIFVSHNPPYNKFTDETSMHAIVYRYVKLANIKIDNQKMGLHSLRHTLATSLMENTNSIILISNILGHKTTETTPIYLKTSIELLRECCCEKDYV
jgi:site-specific recombinase XerD